MAQFSVSSLLAQFMTDLSLPVVDGGLGIEVILGFPELNRAEPAYPMGALTFEEDGFLELPQPIRRMGQIQGFGSGTSILANLYLLAESEEQLLMLVDRLRAVREAKASVDADDHIFRIVYQKTKRNEPDVEMPALRYVTTTPITLNFVS